MKQWLEPLTLDHWFLLHEVESKLLNLHKDVTLSDLRLAVYICSRPAARARRMLEGGFFCDLWLCVYWAFWGMLVSHLKPRIESQIFGEYLRYNVERPATQKRAAEKTRAIPTPDPWRLYSMLRREFGLSAKKARKELLLEANILWAIDADATGKIELVPQDYHSCEVRKRLLEVRAEANRERN